jgi:signal transduction histidine kinase/ActR/RegA family two-component response regulator
MNFPAPVSEYLIDWLSRKYRCGYIMLNKNGNVVSWGGDLVRLGVGPLAEGRPIAEQLFFMEGLLPLAEPFLQLPLIKPDAEHVWDVHLFKAGDDCGLVILDASRDAQKMEAFQQNANELALIHAYQDGSRTAGRTPLSPGWAESILSACNMAALVLAGDGKFYLIGRPPDWLSRICPSLSEEPNPLDPNDVFSFLENFLHDAHEFWAAEKPGSMKSGLWIEPDKSGHEHLFEAIAVCTGQNKILLIAKEHSMAREKQALIQKGREIALDHSSLEKARSKLQADRNALEIRVLERTRDLERINERLQLELEHRRRLEVERTEMMIQLQQAQKMEAIGTLAGGIAHDFNNILSAVIGFTELSLLDVPQGSQLHANLQHVVSAGQRAKKLIRQILTFSRQSNPETQPVQLRQIIHEAIELLRASLPATIEIKQDIQSDAFIMADPSQLHQVVMNLCTNASQAMLPESGVLELALHDRDIGSDHVASYPDMAPGSYLELVVADTGRGMSRQTLKRIFDPFFTTKEKGQGTGMGLAVVHGIVKNCKGDIAVCSEIDHGTTFRVLLPTVKKSNGSQRKMDQVMPRGNERILFVDDEPMQADLAGRFLTPLGYRVEAFTDSTAALNRFYEAPDQFDLVLTDMFMPKMTGRSLAAKINGIRADLPIILCSGFSDSPSETKDPNQHIRGYLMKPFGMKELATTIRRILDE